MHMYVHTKLVSDGHSVKCSTTAYLQMILFQLFPPDLVESSLCFQPFLLFALKPLEDNRQSNTGILLQTFQYISSLIPIYSGNGIEYRLLKTYHRYMYVHTVPTYIHTLQVYSLRHHMIYMSCTHALKTYVHTNFKDIHLNGF